MNSNFQVLTRRLLIAGLSVMFSFVPALVSADESDLAGLWEARRVLGPEVSGPLLIHGSGSNLLAEIGGHRVAASVDENVIAFELPDGARFEGEMEDGGNIRGHWLQPRSKLDSNVFGSPVLLRPRADGWSGEVVPQPDTGTFYLLLTPEDGELTNSALISESYRGIRPAPGYPACPDHTLKQDLFRVLEAPHNVQVELTENFAMMPASSVSGLYFSHPDSRYFGVSRVEHDQLLDYAQRKDMSVAQTARWLAPVLADEPTTASEAGKEAA